MTIRAKSASPTTRRGLLKGMTIAAAVPGAAGLFGGSITTPARADDGDTLPEYAPVPAHALGPVPNAQGYYVGRIRGNLFWITDTNYQAMFLTTRDGVVLVDAPPTLGHNLLRAVRDVTKANGMPNKITHLIYSHSHADHIGASAILGKHVLRIGHSETHALLKRDRDPNRPLPTQTFDDRFVLEVGGERLELAHHGPNHSPDNIYIYAPGHKALMLVDVFFPGWVPFKNLAMSESVPAWLEAHDVAMQYPWQTLIGGHLGRLGSRTDAEIQKTYLSDLDTAVRNAIETVDPSPYVDKYGPSGNSWAVFKTYLDAVARRAADPVAAKYTGKLAGADVYTADHAATLLESLRINAALLGPFGIHP